MPTFKRFTDLFLAAGSARPFAPYEQAPTFPKLSYTQTSDSNEHGVGVAPPTGVRATNPVVALDLCHPINTPSGANGLTPLCMMCLEPPLSALVEYLLAKSAVPLLPQQTSHTNALNLPDSKKDGTDTDLTSPEHAPPAKREREEHEASSAPAPSNTAAPPSATCGVFVLRINPIARSVGEQFRYQMMSFAGGSTPLHFATIQSASESVTLLTQYIDKYHIRICFYCSQYYLSNYGKLGDGTKEEKENPFVFLSSNEDEPTANEAIRNRLSIAECLCLVDNAADKGDNSGCCEKEKAPPLHKHMAPCPNCPSITIMEKVKLFEKEKGESGCASPLPSATKQPSDETTDPSSTCTAGQPFVINRASGGVHPFFARDEDGLTPLHCCTGLSGSIHGGSEFPRTRIAAELFLRHPETDLSVRSFRKSRAPATSNMPPWAQPKPKENEKGEIDLYKIDPHHPRFCVSDPLNELDGPSVAFALAKHDTALDLFWRILARCSTGPCEGKGAAAAPLSAPSLPAALPSLAAIIEKNEAIQHKYRCSASFFGPQTKSFIPEKSEEEKRAIAQAEAKRQEFAADISRANGFLSAERMGMTDPSSVSQIPFPYITAPLFAAVNASSYCLTKLFIDSGFFDVNASVVLKHSTRKLDEKKSTTAPLPKHENVSPASTNEAEISRTTILHIAALLAIKGQSTLEMCQMLVSNGCDVTARNEEGLTALELVQRAYVKQQQQKDDDSGSDDEEEEENNYRREIVNWFKSQSI